MSLLSNLANNMFSKKNLFFFFIFFGVFFHVTGNLIAQKITLKNNLEKQRPIKRQKRQGN